jgi:hypothetical protein
MGKMHSFFYIKASVTHTNLGLQCCSNIKIGVGIAQSVYRRATGWTARVRFPAVQDFSLLSSPNSADIKKTWIYTSTLPYAFMA